jgi:hypothetical protein
VQAFVTVTIPRPSVKVCCVGEIEQCTHLHENVGRLPGQSSEHVPRQPALHKCAAIISCSSIATFCDHSG